MSKDKNKAPGDLLNKKTLGLSLAAIGLFLLMFAAFYAIARIFSSPSLANFLPENTTVAVVQININPGNEQVKHFFESLDGYAVYDPDAFTFVFDEFFNTEFDTEVQPWIGRQIGIALLEQGNTDGLVDNVFFIEVKNEDEALKFMESRGLQSEEDYILSDDYAGNPIYRYALSHSFKFTFVAGNMVIAENDIALKSVIDAAGSRSGRLIDSVLYQKVAHNLPMNSIVFAYSDFVKANTVLKSNGTFMSEKGRELLAFQPFLKLYKAFGVVGVMENQNLTIQTFMALDEEYLAGHDFINFDTKFRANLLELMQKDVLFYAGGIDLKKQLQRYSDFFSSGGEVSYLVFEGMLRAQKSKYFGDTITLEDDIYPLLQGEYAVAVTGTPDDQAFTIMLEMLDPMRDRDSIETIADSFIQTGSVLAPQVFEVELEDGTVVSEIRTVPEEIVRSTEDYHGYEINILASSGNGIFSVYYIVLDNVFVLSTEKSHLEKSIDLFVTPGESMKESDLFLEIISPVIRTSDEVMFADISYLLDNFGGSLPAETLLYLEPFKHFASGKNYFKDGISATNYIKID
ncbi:DUF3352 domain-containing protein [Patescibacteria group bacterium]|nr:DUF3352 domain-containing protein [Patescibacteria group bacterium]